MRVKINSSDKKSAPGFIAAYPNLRFSSIVIVHSFKSEMYGSTNLESGINPEVQRWFSTVDRDGSGRITATELQSALANGQGGTFSDTACKLMIGTFAGSVNILGKFSSKRHKSHSIFV